MFAEGLEWYGSKVSAKAPWRPQGDLVRRVPELQKMFTDSDWTPKAIQIDSKLRFGGKVIFAHLLEALLEKISF